MSTRTPFQWGNANFSWESNPFPNQSANPFTWDIEEERTENQEYLENMKALGLI